MPSRHDDRSTRKPSPRNYLGRREQLRLLMLVGSLMLVVILMNEARKPKNWRWLTDHSEAEQRGDGGDVSIDPDVEIDTRLRPTTGQAGEAEDLPGAIFVPTFRFRPDANLDDEEMAYHRAEINFWAQQFELMDRPDRRRLLQVLKAVRDDEPLSAHEAQTWSQTLALLNSFWQEHTQKAMDSVTFDPQFSAEDRTAWLMILHRMLKHWNEQLHEALAAAPDPAALTKEQRAEVARFQSLFDEMSIGVVRDGTPIARAKESTAWFRLCEQLDRTDAKSLAASQAPDVGFRQIFQQPEEYRGQLIRIRGEAVRAHYRKAPENIAGIEGYYIFVVSPAGHRNDPVLVYALELPEGFPQVKDLDIAKETTELVNIDVEFVGYFFKVAAYKAGDGPRLAPLILAKTPIWTPRLPPGDPEPPNLWLLGGAVIGMALLGIGVAAFVMSRHGDSPAQKYSPSAGGKPQHFAALADEPLAPTPEERVQSLAEGEADGEKEDS